MLTVGRPMTFGRSVGKVFGLETSGISARNWQSQNYLCRLKYLTQDVCGIKSKITAASRLGSYKMVEQ